MFLFKRSPNMLQNKRDIISISIRTGGVIFVRSQSLEKKLEGFLNWITKTMAFNTTCHGSFMPWMTPEAIYASWCSLVLNACDILH